MAIRCCFGQRIVMSPTNAEKSCAVMRGEPSGKGELPTDWSRSVEDRWRNGVEKLHPFALSREMKASK